MISYESWLMSLGDSALNSGWNPLNSTVRSSAGEVWFSGMSVARRAAGQPPPAPSVSAM